MGGLTIPSRQGFSISDPQIFTILNTATLSNVVDFGRNYEYLLLTKNVSTAWGTSATMIFITDLFSSGDMLAVCTPNTGTFYALSLPATSKFKVLITNITPFRRLQLQVTVANVADISVVCYGVNPSVS